MTYYDNGLRGGVSNLGNTAGTTGTVGGQLVFVGGANITLSESRAGGLGTVTIIGGAGGGGGTGVAISAAGNSVSDGTVVFSNAGNVSFGMAGSTVTATATVTQSNQNITAGNGGFAFQTLSFSNVNNVSFSTSAGSAIVASASFPAQTNQTLGLYAVGNTTGESSSSTFDARTISFRGDGFISVGYSGGTVRISGTQTNPVVSNAIQAVGSATGSGTNTSRFAADDHVHAGVFSMGVSNVGNSAGDTRVDVGRFVLAGGANITLSQATAANALNTISIVGGAGGGGNFSAGVSTGGNTAGDTGITGTRLVFVGTNNVTLSQATDANGGTISISAAGGGAGQFSGGVSNLGNTAGATGITGTQNVFVGSGVVSLSQTTGANGGTISILAPATSSLSGTGGISLSTNGSTISIGFNGFTKSRFNPFMEASGSAGQLGQASLHVHPIPDPENFQFDRMLFDVILSNSSNSTGTVTVSVWAGLFTRNASTLSLHASSSTSQAVTFSGTVNNTTYAGPRLLSMGWTTTITQNDYWLGMVSRTTTGGTNASFSQYVAADLNSNFSGMLGAGSNATVQNVLGLGFYTVTTSGIPASIAFSQLNGTVSQAQRVPLYYFLSNTA